MAAQTAAPGHYHLRGVKTFTSGASHITRLVLTGALPNNQGWQLILLRADEPPPTLDRSFYRPLGMRATASFRADFTGLKIGPDNLMDQPNDDLAP